MPSTTTPDLRLEGLHRGRAGANYHPSPALLAAANTALVLETPLLLAGEPGCGKTDFAWYAARALAAAQRHPDPNSVRPFECYVRSDMRAKDLLYQYDALARFADAQHPPKSAPERAADARNYIALQPLGLGLMAAVRRVVLIDEIDKAPRDLPNDLLREMEQGQFSITEIPDGLPGQVFDVNDSTIELRRQMVRPSRGDRPLVIVTSNAERQLPDAFLRRCVFFHIPFPKDETLEEILNEHLRGVPQSGSAGTQTLIKDSIAITTALRSSSLRLIKPPGTAELIGFVRALLRPGRDVDWQDTLPLPKLAGLARSQQAVPWRKVPALHCLVKLKEDLDSLERASPKAV